MIIYFDETKKERLKKFVTQCTVMFNFTRNRMSNADMYNFLDIMELLENELRIETMREEGEVDKEEVSEGIKALRSLTSPLKSLPKSNDYEEGN